jgi:selenide,water dikinase
LLGHLLEVCRGSGIGARIDFDKLPLLPGALDLACAGMITGASDRNMASYVRDVSCGERIDSARRALLTDPQTSGGLLVACARDAVGQVLDVFHAEGFAQAAVIGEIVAGPPHVAVN